MNQPHPPSLFRRPAQRLAALCLLFVLLGVAIGFSQSGAGEGLRMASAHQPALNEFYQHYGYILELISFLVALVMIVPTVIAQRDAKEQVEKLKGLADSLSTRSVGQFPHTLDALTKLLGSAKESVEIWVDTVGYGAFSAPKRFRDYRQLLERLGDEVEVKIHYYDAETIRTARNKQFQRDKNKFEDFRKETKFAEYSEFHGKDSEEIKRLVDWDTFFAFLEQRDTQTENSLSSNKVSISRFHGEQPIFVWMVDGSGGQAMFSVVGGQGGETAFYTRDASLLHALNEIVQRFGRQESATAAS